MVHFKKFANESEYNLDKNELIEPSFSYIADKKKVIYDNEYSPYLTFVTTGSTTIRWRCTDASISKTIQYSVDGGQTWIDLTSSTSGTKFTASTGTVVLFKGTNSAYGASYNDTVIYNYFTVSRKTYFYGNINSLTGNNDSVADYAFYGIFKSCALNNIKNKKLVLPAKTLGQYCYQSMFLNCTSLTEAPELPATTLADCCYREMFNGCSSLTEAPELPATVLADRCYLNMFLNCSSLTTAPALPATTLVSSCYNSMFYGCTSLVKAPALPATTLASSCYRSMFKNCSSLIEAPKLPATTLANYCYREMFNGCTSLEKTPRLASKSLSSGCYYGMFNGCTKVNRVEALFTTNPAASYTTGWLSNVSSTGTFVKNSQSSWNISGVDGVPEGWTLVNI